MPVEPCRFYVRMTGVIVVVLLFFSSAMAGALDDCSAAYDRQDYVLALRLCRPLAEQGDPSAQTALGNLYYEGWGVEQNYTGAANWFRKAAEQGDATGQFSLGWAYEQGDGVLQDYVLAHMWYNLAASQGADVAAKNRDRVAAEMSPEQIAEAQRLAREWKPTK
jgi:TPR repeat protein